MIELLLIAALITFRNDGFLPFTSTTNELVIIASSVFITVLIILLTWAVIKRKGIKLKIESTEVRIALTVLGIILALAATVVLLYKNWIHNQSLYSMNLPLLIITAVVIILAITLALVMYRPKWAFALLITGTALLSVVIINDVPVTAKLADLMPIIQEQTAALQKGEPIYQYFRLDNGVATQAVRQPGMAFAYFPARILQVDHRLMNIFYFAFTQILLIRLLYPDLRKLKFDRKFLLAFAGLALISFLPYRLIRLDLYEYPFWSLLMSCLVALKEKRWNLAILFWGLGIFVQVWFWLFSPFLAVYLWKQTSFKKAFLMSFIAAAIGFGAIFLVIRDNPAAYFEHAFGFYQGVMARGDIVAQSYYLSPIFIRMGLQPLLLPLQVISVGILGLIGLRKLKTFRSLLVFLTLAFLLFIQFNSLTWNYFYIDLLLLLILIYSVDLTKP
jgi:hypothetical protein